MFIAMNRFRVKKGSEDAFEKVWLARDSYLDSVPGFLEFHLLKGPEAEEHTLYSSHSVWQSKRAFEAWTKSKEFRARMFQIERTSGLVTGTLMRVRDGDRVIGYHARWKSYFLRSARNISLARPDQRTGMGFVLTFESATCRPPLSVNQP
jgi:heme-degrading monooxygenase HmoA